MSQYENPIFHQNELCVRMCACCEFSFQNCCSHIGFGFALHNQEVGRRDLFHGKLTPFRESNWVKTKINQNTKVFFVEIFPEIINTINKNKSIFQWTFFVCEICPKKKITKNFWCVTDIMVNEKRWKVFFVLRKSVFPTIKNWLHTSWAKYRRKKKKS